jgi:hypothetical protein
MLSSIDCYLAETMSSVEESMQVVDALSKKSMRPDEAHVSSPLAFDASMLHLGEYASEHTQTG